MIADLNLSWHKIRNGDEHALEETYKSSFSPLVSYAAGITGQVQLAEEIVQDVFLKIWQDRLKLDVKESFKSYLFKSVHNHSLNAVRQLKTRKESANSITSEKTWQFISDNFRIDDDLVERIFSYETEAIVDRTIRELPDQCRKVFILSRIDSLSNREIATRLGLSENTIRTHIYKALQKISSALDGEK
jgi:RNA polymerase sigma-70 factor, ECF subfamily